jgi:large subunit ribosomal protein L3
MAGQLGNATSTSIFLTVVRVDLDRNLLLLRGAVPGHQNSLVVVRDARTRGKKQ